MFVMILSCLPRSCVMVNHCELLAAPTTLGRTPGYVFTASRVSVIPGLKTLLVDGQRYGERTGHQERIHASQASTSLQNVVFICSSFK